MNTRKGKLFTIMSVVGVSLESYRSTHCMIHPQCYNCYVIISDILQNISHIFYKIKSHI